MVLVTVFGSPAYLAGYGGNGLYTLPYVYYSGDVASSLFREVCQHSHYLYSHSLNIVRQQQVSIDRSTSNLSSVPETDKKSELGQSPTAEMFIAPTENITDDASLASTTAAGSETIVCPGCGQQWARKQNLARHWATACPQGLRRTFECPEPGCGMTYTRSDAVKRHQRSRHGAEKLRRGRKKASSG